MSKQTVMHYSLSKQTNCHDFAVQFYRKLNLYCLTLPTTTVKHLRMLKIIETVFMFGAKNIVFVTTKYISTDVAIHAANP
jgi:hypothetical protein